MATKCPGCKKTVYTCKEYLAHKEQCALNPFKKKRKVVKCTG